MKIYKNLEDVYKDWLTLKELCKYLKSHSYPHGRHTIMRWETAGIIPRATRILFRDTEWRVYSKDGSDFKNIIKLLSKAPKRIGNK